MCIRDRKTYTWTVNEPDHMRWCREHGVNVFATDHPHIAVDTFRAADSTPDTGK